jgi:saccharopine dehydrogenase-like NADP-dependent oxidoreductase
LWSAIQVTTAAGIAAVVDLVLARPGKYRGFVRQEQFSLPEVLANRFGAWYSGTDKSVSGRIVVEGKAGRQRSRAGALR